jgi:hypothetical protein
MGDERVKDARKPASAPLEPPNPMPSGWAALLYLYGLR